MADNLTQYGVCYNLERSPFHSTWNGYVFYFSSIKHKESFDKKVSVRIPWMNDSMTRRFKFSVDVSLIAVFQLYTQVETRGFAVDDSVGGCKWRSLENLELGGLLAKWRGSREREPTITDA